jgi:hypothetical protein
MADVMAVQKNHSKKLKMRTYHVIDMTQEHGGRLKENPELDC